jgi:hypothetical protein
VQHIGNETLLYDELRHKAFCLNQISSLVWTLADGTRTPAQIADAASSELQHSVSEEIVRFALRELQRDGLLQPETVPVAISALSRREMVKKLGVGAALLMPVITAVFAPTPAFAASTTGGGGGCLLPNTSIQLVDGTEIEARYITPNQWVRGVDPATGQFHNAQVTSCRSFRAEQLLTFFAESGEVVQSSPSHLFISGPGDVRGTKAAALRTGDSFLVYNQEKARAVPSKITAIQTSDIPQEVVIFELDTVQHCFLSGGVVSHNFLLKNARPAGEVPELESQPENELGTLSNSDTLGKLPE